MSVCRDGIIIKTNPVNFYVDGAGLEYGVNYNYYVTARVITDDGIVLSTDSISLSVCTCKFSTTELFPPAS